MADYLCQENDCIRCVKGTLNLHGALTSQFCLFLNIMDFLYIFLSSRTKPRLKWCNREIFEKNDIIYTWYEPERK